MSCLLNFKELLFVFANLWIVANCAPAYCRQEWIGNWMNAELAD